MKSFSSTVSLCLAALLLSKTMGFVQQPRTIQESFLPLKAPLPKKASNSLHHPTPLHVASIGTRQYYPFSPVYYGTNPWSVRNTTFESTFESWVPMEQPTQVSKRESAKTFLMKGCDWYMQKLDERPLLTKSVSSAIVQVLGDMLAQHLTAFMSGQALVYNMARTLSFGCVGFFFKAPFLNLSYRVNAKLGRKLQNKYKLSDNKRIAAELTMDQTFGVLAFYPPYFFAYEFFSALMTGRAFAFPTFTAAGFAPIVAAMGANYLFWPLSQFLSLKFVPQQLRVLHTNVAAVLWNIGFCSLVAKR